MNVDKKTATERQNKYNGFAVEITDSTDLGFAMLIAESDSGEYEPIGLVATVCEARDIASADMASRMRRLEQGEEPLCPTLYKVWARGVDGEQRVACELNDFRPATK
jgi:hypothetical protein